jgi:hypothetical protein
MRYFFSITKNREKGTVKLYTDWDGGGLDGIVDWIMHIDHRI